MSHEPSTKELLDLLAEIDRLEAITPILRPQKTNIPQREAFACNAQEIGFGGAKYGGKSVLDLMIALYKHHFTKIFRKEYKEHSGMLSFIKLKFGNEGLSMAPPQTFRPPKKRGIKSELITFNHLANGMADISGHQGVSADCIIIDECVYFTEDEVDMLFADCRPLDRVRLEADGLETQCVMTFNPPLTMEGWWVVKRFGPWIDKNHSMFPYPFGKILWTCKIDGDHFFFEENQEVTHHPRTGKQLDRPRTLSSRTFFKSTYKDNEVSRNDPSYLAKLESLPPKMRNAFLYGEMDASLVNQIGQIFSLEGWAAAVARWKNQTPPTGPPLCISIDVASGGDDLFVAIPFWRGGYAGMPASEKGSAFTPDPNAEELRSKSSAQCDWLAKYIQFELWAECDEIDLVYDSGGGYGDAFADEWRRRYPKSTMKAFSGASAAGVNSIFGYETVDKDGALLPPPSIMPISGMPWISGNTSFLNMISAAWVRAGEMLDHPLFEICLPDHDELKRQCTSRLKVEKVAKKLAIEDKEKFKAKIGCSPDYADALVMGLHYLSVFVAVAESYGFKK
jgi:hypothetical protein